MALLLEARAGLLRTFTASSEEGGGKTGPAHGLGRAPPRRLSAAALRSESTANSRGRESTAALACCILTLCGSVVQCPKPKEVFE